MEERIRAASDSEALAILKAAERLRDKWPAAFGTNLPFWEAVSVAAASAGGNKRLLREAVAHDASGGRFDLCVDSLSRQELESRIRDFPSDTLVALYSRCLLSDGSHAHIPMIDFRGDPDEAHLVRVTEGLEAISQTIGVILNSGRSFHFYGFGLLKDAEWIRFMGESLLIAPLADPRYVAHRLIEGVGALRISKSAAKPKVPQVRLVLPERVPYLVSA